jgi:cell division protein FtsI (penicillin-binding protein 3)
MPPIYMAAFYNAVANNGKFMRPYLVKEVIYPDGRRDVRGPEVVRERICSPLTLAKVRDCLEGVVTNGTGKRAQDKYYRQYKKDTSLAVRPLLAGKTGTAQLYNQGYYSHEFNASFVCYFPSERPKYTCLVLISGTNGDAGVVSAPVCREIAEKIVQRDFSMRNFVYRDALWNRYPSVALGYAPDVMMIYRKLGYNIRPVLSPWVSVSPVSGKDSLVVMHSRATDDLASALKGASAKDAVYLLEKKGYRVQIKGVGKVSDVSFSGNWAMLLLKN